MQAGVEHDGVGRAQPARVRGQRVGGVGQVGHVVAQLRGGQFLPVGTPSARRSGADCTHAKEKSAKSMLDRGPRVLSGVGQAGRAVAELCGSEVLPVGTPCTRADGAVYTCKSRQAARVRGQRVGGVGQAGHTLWGSYVSKGMCTWSKASGVVGVSDEACAIGSVPPRRAPSRAPPVTRCLPAQAPLKNPVPALQRGSLGFVDRDFPYVACVKGHKYFVQL